MSQVEIQFEGICVNFNRSDHEFLPVEHRIVLINASTITNVWGNTIAPHLAGFSVGPDLTVPTIPLTGAVMKITNPIVDSAGPSVTFDPSFANNVPSLTELTPGMTSHPSLSVLLGNNPNLVACYFDVEFGTISSRQSVHGGFMTVVTIQTNGDPMYELTPFATGLCSSQILQVGKQPATNQMFISNEETDVSQGRDSDFLLSYLVLSPPPSDQPNVPGATSPGSTINRKSEIAASLGLFGMTEVGCSNSAYP